MTGKKRKHTDTHTHTEININIKETLITVIHVSTRERPNGTHDCAPP